MVLKTISPGCGIRASHFTFTVNLSVSRTVLLESLSILQSTGTSLLLERLIIGCLLDIPLYLRLPYWCTSSYKVVVLNISSLFLKLNRMSTIHIKVKLKVCCSRFHTLPHQYELTKYFGFSFAYDAPKIRNDLPDDVSLATSLQTYHLQKRTHPSFWLCPHLFLLC